MLNTSLLRAVEQVVVHLLLNMVVEVEALVDSERAQDLQYNPD